MCVRKRRGVCDVCVCVRERGNFEGKDCEVVLGF